MGRTSDDKQSPSKIRKTTPISEPIKLSLAVLGLALILIALLPAALQPNRLLSLPYIHFAAVALIGSGTTLLILSRSLLRVRRHWAHFLMLCGSIGIMAPCVALYVLSMLQNTLEVTAAGLFAMLLFMVCVLVILGASGVCCVVSALVVLFVKTDSTGEEKQK